MRSARQLIANAIDGLRYRLTGVNPCRVVGQGNTIENRGRLHAVHIEIHGDGNRIRIEDDCHLSDLLIRVRGDGHLVHIKRGAWIKGGEIWIEDSSGILEVGEDSRIESAHLAVTEIGSRLVIGSRCLFANAVEIRTGDSHSVLGPDGARINPARDVVIGSHVWIGSRAMILKGVSVGNDSVVGAGAVVTGAVPPHCIVAGNPARVVKEGIGWDIARTPREP